MRTVRISPQRYELVARGALLALAFIVVTGAAVRLTGSGLGCPDWPTCANDRVIAPLEYHALVEFVNRVVTGVVSLAVVLAVLGARWRDPYRPDLMRWSLGLVAGVAAQVLLGGATVLLHLAPVVVMGHFVVSMVLLWNATVLHERAATAPGKRTATAPHDVIGAARLAVVTAAAVIVTGTVVTASGPHGGDDSAERLSFFVPDVARVHGVAMVIFLATALAAVLRARRRTGPRVQRRGLVLLAVLVAQAAVGYTQYFTGVPALLVGVHVAGAATVWVAVLRFHLSLFAPVAATTAGPTRSSEKAVAAR